MFGRELHPLLTSCERRSLKIASLSPQSEATGLSLKSEAAPQDSQKGAGGPLYRSSLPRGWAQNLRQPRVHQRGEAGRVKGSCEARQDPCLLRGAGRLRSRCSRQQASRASRRIPGRQRVLFLTEGLRAIIPPRQGRGRRASFPGLGCALLKTSSEGTAPARPAPPRWSPGFYL